MDRNRLINFVGETWVDHLMPFFKGKDWINIQKELQNDKRAGYPICPDLKDIFRCFKECPYDKLHSVILVNECYNLRYRGDEETKGYFFADGIALSAKNNINCPVVLNHIFDSLEQLYIPEKDSKISDTDDYDLVRWANQGILLLNCALTTVVKSNYAHAKIWEPFIVYICELLNYHKDRLGIIFIGTYAKRFHSIFDNSTFELYKCEHPIEAISNGRMWYDNDVFSNLTKFQYQKNNIKINWE